MICSHFTYKYIFILNDCCGEAKTKQIELKLNIRALNQSFELRFVVKVIVVKSSCLRATINPSSQQCTNRGCTTAYGRG